MHVAFISLFVDHDRYQDQQGASFCLTCPEGRYHGYATPADARVFVGLVPTAYGDDGVNPCVRDGSNSVRSVRACAACVS